MLWTELLALLHLLLLLLRAGPAVSQVTCVKQINSCKCETNSGKFIDLSPLAGTSDYRFKQVVGPNRNWAYSYNPCNGLKCDTYSNAAGCQSDIKATMFFQIGLQDTAQFGYSSADGLHIKYTNGQASGVQRMSIVSLVCKPGAASDEFQPTDDGGTTNPYVFHSRLTSKHACEVDSGGGGGGGMSVGDVLLIVFFVLLIVYLAGGFAVNVLVLKQAAGPHALPNVVFWVALPGYVKDGAAFTVNGARQLVKGRQSEYETV